MLTPEQPDKSKSFAAWTDDEIRDRAAELHADPATVSLDHTRPIVRTAADCVLIPAWIELCPWD